MNADKYVNNFLTLINKRDNLVAEIAQIENEIKNLATNTLPDNKPQRNVDPRAGKPKPLKTRVMMLFGHNRNKELQVGDIAKRLKASPSAIGQICGALAEAGRINRVKNGIYKKT